MDEDEPGADPDSPLISSLLQKDEQGRRKAHVAEGIQELSPGFPTAKREIHEDDNIFGSLADTNDADTEEKEGRTPLVFSFPSARREVYEELSGKPSLPLADTNGGEEEESSSDSEGEDEKEVNDDGNENSENRKNPQTAPRFSWRRHKNVEEPKQHSIDRGNPEEKEGVRDQIMEGQGKAISPPVGFDNLFHNIRRHTHGFRDKRKLTPMKVATEDTKYQKDWKESVSDAFAFVLNPEAFVEADHSEDNFGGYRPVTFLDRCVSEAGDNKKDNNGSTYYKKEAHRLAGRVRVLERQAKCWELEAQGWRGRVKELEQEVRSMRCCRDDDSSAAPNAIEDSEKGLMMPLKRT